MCALLAVVLSRGSTSRVVAAAEPIPNDLCEQQSPWVAEKPCDHTWWPRERDSSHAYDRLALESRRSAVESLPGVLRHCGVGVRDGRALWVCDAG